MVEWLKFGIDLPFEKIPEPFCLKNRNFHAKEKVFIKEELSRLLDLGVIRKDDNVKYISPINCVPKKNNKFRLIIDLRVLNSNLTVKNFKYEDINSVLELVDHKDKLVTLDIKDGFYHVPLSKNAQQYMGFMFDNQKYTWCKLPFGLCVSPYFFCKTLRPIVTYLRSIGIKISVYVDDFIIAANEQFIVEHRDTVLDILNKLGIVVNLEKSSLTPECKKEYIGYIIDTDYLDKYVWLQIPQKRITKVLHDIDRVLKKGRISARALARITGQCISMSKAVLPAKLKLRNLYRLLKTRHSWQDILVLDNSSLTDLGWWKASLKSWNGCVIQNRTVDIQLITDASTVGWGGFIPGKEAQGLWTPEVSFKNSNLREMVAVLYSMIAFRKDLRGKMVQVLSDNIATVANINFQGGPSKDLTQIASAIWTEALSNNVTLKAKYLAGIENTHADYLSRRVVQTDWMLNPRLFHYLDLLWGPHTIDRCASMTNRQLPVYNSLYFDPQTHGVDCLTQKDWQDHNNFVNPPFCIIPQILRVIQEQKAEATIIAPYWKSKMWLQTLKRLSISPPIRLKHLNRACLDFGVRPEPLKNPRWKIFAWRISGRENYVQLDGQIEL